MAEIVICHHPRDRDMAGRLAEALAGEGYGVRREEADASAPIGAAKAAIIVWSHAAAASRPLRASAEAARIAGKLVQLSVDHTMPPLPFNMLHLVSIGDWQGEAGHPGWLKIKARLALLCPDGG